jgi:sortase family protein
MAAEATGPPPLPAQPCVRERRAGPMLAFMLPALAAAGAVVILASSEAGPLNGPDGNAARLARAAERPAGPPAPAGSRELRPIVALPGVAGLEPSPLEPLEGGIRPAPPARIAIAAAGVDAVVEPVRERKSGIEVPRIGRAGWFEGGPRPGEMGRAVLIGHLDTRKGPGLFARVPKLPPGTEIRVTDRRGGVYSYRVVGGAEVRKDRFPARYVYGGSDRPVLVLITCGGPYRPGKGYRDNVLLYARSA